MEQIHATDAVDQAMIRTAHNALVDQGVLDLASFDSAHVEYLPFDPKDEYGPIAYVKWPNIKGDFIHIHEINEGDQLAPKSNSAKLAAEHVLFGCRLLP